jgi:hypothetical protein
MAKYVEEPSYAVDACPEASGEAYDMGDLPSPGNSEVGRCSFSRLFLRNNQKPIKPTSASAPTAPPTAPPMIAPLLEEPPEEVEVGVDVCTVSARVAARVEGVYDSLK